MLDIVLRVISKYAQSHMYDIYAMLSGTIAYIIVMSIKIMYKKQLNKFLILVMSVIFGALIFVVASHISPQVYVDAHAGRGVGSILYAGGIAFAEYVVIDLLSNNMLNILGVIAAFAFALYINIYFCEMLGTHYKACFGVKIGVAICCAWGVIRMVLITDSNKAKK